MSVTFLPDGRAEITRRSPVSGTTNTITVRMTFRQYERWGRGEELIQRALPHLSPDEREFLLTGITAAEWNDNIKDDEQ